MPMLFDSQVYAAMQDNGKSAFTAMRSARSPRHPECRPRSRSGGLNGARAATLPDCLSPSAAKAPRRHMHLKGMAVDRDPRTLFERVGLIHRPPMLGLS